MKLKSPRLVSELGRYGEIRPAVNQIEVHPLMTQEENIAYNHSLGIQVEAWGPFGQGDIDVIGHPLLQSLAATRRACRPCDSSD